MPIYEYACAKCESEFEAEQRITDEPLKTCPRCRSKRVKRLISRTSFALKGGGWYADGYGTARSESKGSDAAKSDGKSSGESSGGSQSDSSTSKSKGKTPDSSKAKKAVA
ncbi:MAG: FmdB family zinc ribbon protein [Myxococcota bacterium]